VRLFTCLVLIIVMVSAASAQKMPRQHKRLPYFLTLNSERLAGRLTRGLDSDSAKAVAIHSWITYNIKYDVKKWQRFDYERIPVKGILRRRKAICVGYSDLFTELCGYAGLKSVQVPGYTKNINVDISDNFYLDDHMWNAVLIDGRWKLVDATWDAGYIKYYKRTLIGYVTAFFTLGKVSFIKYKPHFKTYPIDAYCMRPGSFFKTDHLPLNPLWQITDPPLSIEDFRNDSSFYFKKYDFKAEDTGNRYGPGTDRSDYISSSFDDRDKADGISGNAFNRRNHYCIGNTWFIRVQEAIKEIDPASEDTVGQLKACDTVIMHIDSALAHYELNAALLLTQKEELTASNVNKKRKFVENNNLLISSTKNTIRKLSKGQALSFNAKSFCRSLSRDQAKIFRELGKDKSFSKTKPQKIETRYTDSLAIIKGINAIGDSIAVHRSKIDGHFRELDSLYAALQARHINYSSGVQVSRSFLATIYFIRLSYYDDNDYEVRRFEDTLIRRKIMNDSSLYVGNELMLDYTIGKLKASKAELAVQWRFYKTKLQLLKKLKASCAENKEIQKAYKATLDTMGVEIDRWNEVLSDWMGRCDVQKMYCRAQKKRTRKELKALLKERRLEYQLYHVRGSYIRKRSASLINLNQNKKRKLLLQKRETERQKQKRLQKKK
jgi:hypothetical protein